MPPGPHCRPGHSGEMIMTRLSLPVTRTLCTESLSVRRKLHSLPQGPGPTPRNQPGEMMDCPSREAPQEPSGSPQAPRANLAHLHLKTQRPRGWGARLQLPKVTEPQLPGPGLEPRFSDSLFSIRGPRLGFSNFSLYWNLLEGL